MECNGILQVQEISYIESIIIVKIWMQYVIKKKLSILPLVEYMAC